MTETTAYDMTTDEAAEAEAMLAQLHADGYRDIPEHGSLRPGVRIRHRGDQYPQAYDHGTGVVLHVTEKSPSSWSVSYGAPDIEMVVLYDRPRLGGSRLSQLAQYHVEVVEMPS